MKNIEINTERLIVTPEQYFMDERVSRAMLEFMGVDHENSWTMAGMTSHAFLGVGTEAKALAGRMSPVSAIEPEEILARIGSNNGKIELFVSLRQKESAVNPGLPQKVILLWDVDRFHISEDGNYDEGMLIANPVGTFNSLSSTRILYERMFDNLDIPTLTVASGKGYHFFSQVSDKEVIKKIIQIGGPTESTVAGKLAYAHMHSKCPVPIALFHDQAFKGSSRLQQYVNTFLIRKARDGNPLQVEIWDKGFPNGITEGIALDNTGVLQTTQTKLIGSLGSPYFLKAKRSGLQLDRLILQLPVKGNGFEYAIEDILASRYSFEKSAKLLESTDCSIPESSSSVNRVIDEYYQSELYRLHQAMDTSEGDSPDQFNHSYRRNNYEDVIRQTREPELMRWMITYANPVLVQMRYYVDRLIWNVFEAWGGSRTNLGPAPYVAGFLRAIYEDPNLNWGGKWRRHYDALRWARGSVEQVLGQLFEQ
jgi:hypothetical protein